MFFGSAGVGECALSSSFSWVRTSTTPATESGECRRNGFFFWLCSAVLRGQSSACMPFTTKPGIGISNGGYLPSYCSSYWFCTGQSRTSFRFAEKYFSRQKISKCEQLLLTNPELSATIFLVDLTFNQGVVICRRP